MLKNTQDIEWIQQIVEWNCHNKDSVEEWIQEEMEKMSKLFGQTKKTVFNPKKKKKVIYVH